MFCYLVFTYEKTNGRWGFYNTYLHANNIREVIDEFFHSKDCLIINIIRFGDELVG